MDHEAFIGTVMGVVGLLFIAAISAVVMKRLRFPYTVGLVLVGVAVAFVAEDFPTLGETLQHLKFGPAMIMFLFIPILIFESAFNMDVPLLLRNLGPTLVLAGPGLLLSTAIVGGLIHYLTALPLGSALIFGCLISATDPVAVIALFKELGAPKSLTVLVEGESVFNDATAIVTFQIVLAVIAAGILDLETVTSGIVSFFFVFFGGLAVGLIFGYALVAVMPMIREEPLVHITLTLACAYAAFFVADHFLDTSGIMAVLGAGLVVGYYGPVYQKARVQEYLKIFWEDAAFVANSLIFLMLGLSEKVFISNSHKNVDGLLIPTLTAVFVVLLARGLVVYSLIPLINAVRRRKVDHKYKAVLAWGGLRGAVAVALAMSLPPNFPYRWQIIDFTFGVTLFMLVFNGTTVGWLINRLGLNRESPLLRLMRSYADVIAKRVALDHLGERTPDELRRGRPLGRVKADYEKRLREAESNLRNLRAQLCQDRAVRRKLLWLRALAIEHHVYLARHELGLLSLSSLRVLERNLGTSVREVGQGAADCFVATERGGGTLRYFSGLISSSWPRKQRMLERHEQMAAIRDACRRVLSQMSHLADFSGAEREDMEECRSYYGSLERHASEALMAEELQQVGPERLATRLLQRLTNDAESTATHRLSISPRVSEALLETVEQDLKPRIALPMQQ